QIGTAETYDVIVRPQEERAYTAMAETNDFCGYARATLAPRLGMEAPVPPLRPRPLLTMKDMGMDHAAMGQASQSVQPEMDHSTMDHPAMNHGAMQHEHAAAAGDHAAMDHS